MYTDYEIVCMVSFSKKVDDEAHGRPIYPLSNFVIRWFEGGTRISKRLEIYWKENLHESTYRLYLVKWVKSYPIATCHMKACRFVLIL